MDDRKAIELMAVYFKGLAETVDGNEPEQKKLYFKLQKVMTQFVDWYDKVRSEDGWYSGMDDAGYPIVKKLPATTGLDELKEYENGLMKILDDFNTRNISGMNVMEYFDSYLNRIRYGWKKRDRELAQK